MNVMQTKSVVAGRQVSVYLITLSALKCDRAHRRGEGGASSYSEVSAETVFNKLERSYLKKPRGDA